MHVLLPAWLAFSLVAAAAAPVCADTGVAEGFLYAMLPVTPDQAREVAALLRSPDRVVVDLADATGALLASAPSLPGALLHDLVTAPVRDLRMLGAVVGDLVDVGDRRGTGRRPLFGRTLAALRSSALLSKAADAVERLVHPENRTVRLAVVLTARAYGAPVEDRDLDAVRQAIDRDAPDLAPLLARFLERLADVYGRDALRVVLAR